MQRRLPIRTTCAQYYTSIVYEILSPIENSWKQGIIIRSLVGVPDSFVVEINGQQYRQNKCDITFSSPKGNDGAVGGATGSQHATRNKMELRTEVMDYDQDQH